MARRAAIRSPTVGWLRSHRIQPAPRAIVEAIARRAEAFGRSDDLREAMRRPGVVGQPEIRFAD